MYKDDFSFYNLIKFKATLSIGVSLFFYLFLIFFLPFGVDNYDPNLKYTVGFLLEIVNFAVGVFVVLVLNEFVFRPYIFKEVTFRKCILWTAWTMFLLSTTVFYIYNYLGGWHDYTFISFLGFIANVSSVLIFPFVGIFFFFRYRSLRSFVEHILTTKEKFIDAKQLIKFRGQGAKDEITLSVANFLYGKAQDNYVELFYLEQNEIKSFLIRSPLKKLIDSVDSEVLSRSHRSYMVNLLHVNAIKGVNNEMKLFLDPFDSKIPVSKSYQEIVLNQLQGIKNFG